MAGAHGTFIHRKALLGSMRSQKLLACNPRQDSASEARLGWRSPLQCINLGILTAAKSVFLALLVVASMFALLEGMQTAPSLRVMDDLSWLHKKYTKNRCPITSSE